MLRCGVLEMFGGLTLSTSQMVPLSQPNTTASFRAWHVEQIAADVKESVCRVSEGYWDPDQNANIPMVSYEVRHAGPGTVHIPACVDVCVCVLCLAMVVPRFMTPCVCVCGCTTCIFVCAYMFMWGTTVLCGYLCVYVSVHMSGNVGMRVGVSHLHSSGHD